MGTDGSPIMTHYSWEFCNWKDKLFTKYTFVFALLSRVNIKNKINAQSYVRSALWSTLSDIRHGPFHLCFEAMCPFNFRARLLFYICQSLSLLLFCVSLLGWRSSCYLWRQHDIDSQLVIIAPQDSLLLQWQKVNYFIQISDGKHWLAQIDLISGGKITKAIYYMSTIVQYETKQTKL